MRNRVLALIVVAVAALGCNEPTAVNDVERVPAQFIAIAAGGYHACGVDTIGRAWCWGSNQAGAVGVGLGLCRDCGGQPRRVQTSLRFTAITAGTSHTCGIDTDKRAYCWGDDYFSALGTGQANVCGASDGRLCSAFPVPVGGNFTFKSIVAGTFGTCGLTESGIAKCWGYQAFTANLLLPTPVTVRFQPTGDSSWALIGHTDAGLSGCGVTSSNAASCWGPNFLGQLGLGFLSDARAAPIAVTLPEPVRSVSNGSGFACALAIAGDVWCWGLSVNGSLGLGSAPSVGCSSSSTGVCHPTPTKVIGGRHYSSLAVGWQHVCAIDATSAETYCWGSNGAGAIGTAELATSQIATTPTRAADGLKFTSLSAGYQFTCGLLADRSAYCWGVNAQGQISLTDGTVYSAKPVRITVPAQ
jgi:hypothetical protein